jgi:hypothetical protein
MSPLSAHPYTYELLVAYLNRYATNATTFSSLSSKASMMSGFNVFWMKFYMNLFNR